MRVASAAMIMSSGDDWRLQNYSVIIIIKAISIIIDVINNIMNIIILLEKELGILNAHPPASIKKADMQHLLRRTKDW